MEAGSLIDKPLQSKDQEALGIDDYAEVLADFIKISETPMTLGIQGDWGIGKTSLQNMLEEELGYRRGRGGNYPTVYINTWQYAQFERQDLLGVVILKAMIDQIRTSLEDHEPDAVAGAKKLFSSLADAADQLAENQLGVSAKKAVEAGEEPDELAQFDGANTSQLVEEYKSKFEQLVDELIDDDGSKLVFMIDDLDRLQPTRALEVLEVMKNFLDVPKCVFVLAIDYSVIQRGVREKFGSDTQRRHGKSFFDKIIQIPFNMPVSSYDVDQYIMSLMGWSYDAAKERFVPDYQSRDVDDDGFFLAKTGHKSLKPDIASYFSNITQLTVGKNPRSIKRAVNYANLLRLLVRQFREGSGRQGWRLEDAQLLYPLACMQLAWPELFHYFAENPVPGTIDQFEDWDFLESLPDAQPIFDRVSDETKLKSNISGFFDELIALLDEDKDGEISVKEFQPVWEIMNEANLTAVPLEDNEEVWDEFRGRAKTLNADRSNPWPETVIDAAIELFRREDSKWSNRVHFEIIGAGKRFYNLTWDGDQIGSIATTKGEPVQIYLKADPQRIGRAVSEETVEFLRNVTGKGHYGTGDTKVALNPLFDEPEDRRIEIMNELLTQLLALDESEPSRAGESASTDRAAE